LEKISPVSGAEGLTAGALGGQGRWMINTIAVVGAGALGIYYGGRFARAGREVRFLVRGEAARLRERGLVLEYGDERHEVRPVRAETEPEAIGPVDLVVVALKATANGELARLLPPLLGPRTLVVNLQNGLGVDEALAAVAGAERTLGALCFVAVNRIAPGEAFCSEQGYVEIGEFGRVSGEAAEAVTEVFSSAGVKARVRESLLTARWRKLVWNVPFNGLTLAMGGVTSDATLREPAGEARVRALMREVRAIARAEGVEIEDSFLESQINHTRGMRYKPSTMLDWLAGRPLELEPIWGEPLRRARAHGVPAPELERLHGELIERARSGPQM
jgi:2-dehydropantoate 2-reductase